jgi:hypothetical protein
MQNIARLITADKDAPEKVKKVCRLVTRQVADNRNQQQDS